MPTVNDSDKDPVLARVFDTELKKSEAIKALKGTYDAEDSVRVFLEFTESWIREQSLIHKAKLELTNFEKNKADLIIKYYNDLLVYEFQEKVLQQRLDTAVSGAELTDYYQKNQQNFELKENILRLHFAKIPDPLPNGDKLWKKFVNGDPRDLDAIRQLVERTGGNYFNDDSLWLTFNDILKEIPIVTYNQENYLNNNQFIKLVDNGYTYFVRILEFKVKNNISPLEFEKPRIRNIILNKRKTELLKLIEDEIVKEAYSEGKVTIN